MLRDRSSLPFRLALSLAAALLIVIRAIQTASSRLSASLAGASRMPRSLFRLNPGCLRLRSFAPITLIAGGISLLAYVGSQYADMYLTQRHLEAEWQARQSALKSEKDLSKEGQARMVRLVIPKIDLASIIVEGTSHRDLLIGPGHLASTVEPGQPGNAVISGHRDTFFRHIHELEKGDEFYVERGDQKLTYQVTGKRIVEPTDLSVLKATQDSEITLITCYPTYYIGPAPKRLVVFSKLVQTAEEPVNRAQEEAVPAMHVGALGISTAH